MNCHSAHGSISEALLTLRRPSFVRAAHIQQRHQTNPGRVLTPCLTSIAVARTAPRVMAAITLQCVTDLVGRKIVAMKKVVHLSLALATMSLAQQIPPIVDTAAGTPSSQGSPLLRRKPVRPKRGEGNGRPAKLTLEEGLSLPRSTVKRVFGFRRIGMWPQGAFIRRFDYRVKAKAAPGCSPDWP